MIIKPDNFTFAIIFVFIAVFISSYHKNLYGDVVAQGNSTGNSLDQKFQQKIRTQKTEGKVPLSGKKYSLRRFANQLGEVISGQRDRNLLRNFLVQEEDLGRLGISSQRIAKVKSRLDIETQAFMHKIKKFQEGRGKSSFRLKVLEMEDVEFVPLSQNAVILALKNVSFYYISFSKDFSKSETAILQIPALFLLNKQWKISEVGKIYIPALNQ